VTINWQGVIVTVFTTVGGGAVLLGAAAYLIKSAITQLLALDVEAFKAEFKASADTEIERAKDFAPDDRARARGSILRTPRETSRGYRGVVQTPRGTSLRAQEYARAERHLSCERVGERSTFAKSLLVNWTEHKILSPILQS
jgi:hypothetical protein